jgi:zinc resistance-associated protein
MKTALSAVAVAAALIFAPLAGGTFAAVDDGAQRHGQFTAEDRAAFLDAHIAALKAGLELTADQAKNWPPLESAMRDLAKERADRFAAWQAQRQQDQELSPVDRLTRASERMSARSADLLKLAAAAKPLYDSLDDSQKRRFAMLFTPMGHRHWRHWGRHDG